MKRAYPVAVVAFLLFCAFDSRFAVSGFSRAEGGWSIRQVAVPAAQASPAVPLDARAVFTDAFPPEEFAARRARVIEQIGEAVAILQGAPERPGEQPFRQNNNFFYLTGVELPRALVVIDGRAKRSTLYLQPRDQRRERMYGPLLYPGDEAVRITGIESVVTRDEFQKALAAFARERRTFYTTFRPEVLGSASGSDTAAFAANTANDPWDGRPSREAAFLQKLHTIAPQAEVRNLDPILDRMRFIKSPREIAVIKEATRIAGEAIMEAMREAKPGKYEHELQAAAEYVYVKNGAQGPAYFALIATGPNTVYSHYHKGAARLADGDWVQIDWAPDYQYYVSDITRVFPANGRFTPFQREFYSVYLQLYRSIVACIRPHVAPRDCLEEAVVKMDAVLASFKFTDPKIKEAATRFVERYRNSNANSIGHTIGLEVHDVGNSPTFEPGEVVTLEPAMTIPDDRVSMRLEDSILITETGYEVLSGFVPIEIDAVEKTMREPGLGVRPPAQPPKTTVAPKKR
jgi:Xaa-Pro aminopeptidase